MLVPQDTIRVQAAMAQPALQAPRKVMLARQDTIRVQAATAARRAQVVSIQVRLVLLVKQVQLAPTAQQAIHKQATQVPLVTVLERTGLAPEAHPHKPETQALVLTAQVRAAINKAVVPVRAAKQEQLVRVPIAKTLGTKAVPLDADVNAELPPEIRPITLDYLVE
jgi:hypothetical protein